MIWVAFIPTYIATQERQEIQNGFIASAVVVSAFVVLVCFFSPKVFVIFFWQERNTKHYCRKRVGSNKYDINPHGSMLTTTMSGLEMSYTGHKQGTVQYSTLRIINQLLYIMLSPVCVPNAVINVRPKCLPPSPY